MTLLNEARLNEKLAEHELDAIVATAPENVTYTTGYWALSQWIRRGPQTYVVWPAPGRGAPQIVASAGLLDLIADQRIAVEKVHKFGDFFVSQEPDAVLGDIDRRQSRLYALPNGGSAAACLEQALAGLELNGGRIGIDEGGLPPSLASPLSQSLEDFSVVPAFEIFRQVRAVKTQSEVSRLASAARAAEASIDAALRVAAPGVTELEMAREFNLETVRHDVLPVLFCIGFGPRSAMPNVQPSDAALKEGDIIRFDVGGRFEHYRADIARIAVLGEPSHKIKTYHDALHKGVLSGFEAIRPGAKAADIFDRVVKTVQREGIPHYQRSHVGHGIGIDGYDLPILSASSPDIIEAGMVLCVETPYYELGFGGLQVEDMIVVREDGVQSLMNSSGALRVV